MSSFFYFSSTNNYIIQLYIVLYHFSCAMILKMSMISKLVEDGFIFHQSILVFQNLTVYDECWLLKVVKGIFREAVSMLVSKYLVFHFVAHSTGEILYGFH